MFKKIICLLACMLPLLKARDTFAKDFKHCVVENISFRKDGGQNASLRCFTGAKVKNWESCDLQPALKDPRGKYLRESPTQLRPNECNELKSLRSKRAALEDDFRKTCGYCATVPESGTQTVDVNSNSVSLFLAAMRDDLALTDVTIEGSALVSGSVQRFSEPYLSAFDENNALLDDDRDENADEPSYHFEPVSEQNQLKTKGYCEYLKSDIVAEISNLEKFIQKKKADKARCLERDA